MGAALNTPCATAAVQRKAFPVGPVVNRFLWKFVCARGVVGFPGLHDTVGVDDWRQEGIPDALHQTITQRRHGGHAGISSRLDYSAGIRTGTCWFVCCLSALLVQRTVPRRSSVCISEQADDLSGGRPASAASRPRRVLDFPIHAAISSGNVMPRTRR